MMFTLLEFSTLARRSVEDRKVAKYHRSSNRRPWERARCSRSRDIAGATAPAIGETQIANLLHEGTTSLRSKGYSSGDKIRGTNVGDKESAPRATKGNWHVGCAVDSINKVKGDAEVVVTDGSKSAGDSNFAPWRMIRLAAMLLSLLNLFAACGIPTSRTTVIPEDVGQTPEQLIGKLDLLRNGMEIGEVYELLCIKRTTPGVREIVNAEEKQRVLYGATQLVGSPVELEHFRDHLGKHRIIEIRFRDIAYSLVFDSPVSVVARKVGPDFLSYLVFYEGKLIGPPSKPDNFHQEESTRLYISELLGRMFKLGASRGVSQIGD